MLGSASWEALGTRVVLRTADPHALASARRAVERELSAIDRACSRFRADSELSRANARAGRPMRITALFAQALDVALRAARLTDGDVDPTLGAALELAGYDRDYGLLRAPHASAPRGETLPLATAPDASPPPPPPVRVAARVRAGWVTVRLDRDRLTLRMPRGIKLDLGATAKAWAADRAAGAACAAADCGVLVGVGGDIATDGCPPGSGWNVHVTDDHRSEPCAAGQTVSIRTGGLATSSTAVRRWSRGPATMHHIIDPATQAPVERTWRTISVAAASCTDANIATTGALVRAAGAPAWLAAIGLPARLIAWSGRVITVGDWPTGSLGEDRPT